MVVHNFYIYLYYRIIDHDRLLCSIKELRFFSLNIPPSVATWCNPFLIPNPTLSLPLLWPPFFHSILVHCIAIKATAPFNNTYFRSFLSHDRPSGFAPWFVPPPPSSLFQHLHIPQAFPDSKWKPYPKELIFIFLYPYHRTIWWGIPRKETVPLPLITSISHFPLLQSPPTLTTPDGWTEERPWVNHAITN